ncbi:hypothetical protein AYI68_g3035, partial [Smittium mucronatum]
MSLKVVRHFTQRQMTQRRLIQLIWPNGHFIQKHLANSTH